MKGSRSELSSDLCAEILGFVGSLRQPAMLEEGGLLLHFAKGLPDDLAGGGWRLEVEFGKLLLRFWSDGRSVVRRIGGPSSSKAIPTPRRSAPD